MRRYFALFAPIALVACSTEANHLGNPLLWPIYAMSSGLDNAAYNARRAEVELHVKTNYDGLLAEIADGGGSLLSRAMDLSGVPLADRPARILQMQGDLGLYQTSAEALVVTLMVYGG